jgi:hypothetical protein
MRPLVKFGYCECEQPHYRLVRRHWWMRLFPSRKRYRCATCGATMLLKNERYVDVKRVIAVVAVVTVALAATWLWSSYHENTVDQASKRRLESPP